MDIKQRLENASLVLKQFNEDDYLEPSEIVSISEDTGVNDLSRIAKTIIYIRKRFNENASRYEAFKCAFPERCVVTDTDAPLGSEEKKVGDELGRTTIELKAKRLENSKLYKYIVSTLHTSLYVTYALDRMKVLDLSLKKIFDERTKDRDRIEYMKTFLQETRKPEKAQELELNVNIQNNEINVVQIEDKLDKIANRLQGLDASKVIEMTSNQREKDD